MEYLGQNFSSANTGNLDLMNLINLYLSPSLYQEGSSGAVTFTRNRKEHTLIPTIVRLLLLPSCHDIIQGHLNHLDLDIPLNIVRVYYIDDFMSMRTDEPEPAHILKVLIKLCAAEGWR